MTHNEVKLQSWITESYLHILFITCQGTQVLQQRSDMYDSGRYLFHYILFWVWRISVNVIMGRKSNNLCKPLSLTLHWAAGVASGRWESVRLNFSLIPTGLSPEIWSSMHSFMLSEAHAPSLPTATRCLNFTGKWWNAEWGIWSFFAQQLHSNACKDLNMCVWAESDSTKNRRRENRSCRWALVDVNIILSTDRFSFQEVAHMFSITSQIISCCDLSTHTDKQYLLP